MIPSLGRVEKPAPHITWQFKDISSLLTVIDEVPEYWELDCCGRVRVLMRLASQFAKDVEVLTVFSLIIPAEELNPSHPVAYITDYSEEAKQKRDWAQRMRIYREYGGTAGPGENWCRNLVGMPCLRLVDPEMGQVLIDTSSSGILLGEDKTESFSGLEFKHGSVVMSIPQWTNYDKACEDEGTNYPYPDKGELYFLVTEPDLMKKKRIHYELCENWVVPAKTRKVFQAIYNYCNQSSSLKWTMDPARSY